MGTQQHIDYTKFRIGRANTAMEKLSFLLLSMAVLWITLTFATPSAAEQGETDLIMGLKTLNRGLRSADSKRKGDIKKKNKQRRNNKKGKAKKKKKGRPKKKKKKKKKK